VVFVRHALPGEVVLVEVTEDNGGGFCRADAVEVRTPAPGRVSPPCALAEMALGANRCGGCDWQHASAPTQRELKSAVVTEQLRRIANIDYPVEVRELPDGQLGWRSRVRLAVDRRGRPGFRAHRSHRVIPIEDCPITMAGTLSDVTVRSWPPGSELEVTHDATDAVHVTVRAPSGRKRGAPQLARGSGVAHEKASGRSWDISVQGFWQVHPAAAETFATVVARMAAAPTGGVAWDLYGGVGLFAAVLAEQVGAAGSVLLVESVRGAAEDAAANLRDLPQIEIRAGLVEEVVGDETLDRPDVVVLDPPRKGAGRAVVETVAAHRPSRIVHVACDPAALARDIGLYRDNGYRLVEIEAFDAFPMTHHIECLALLERAAGD
jgi:tRNA/tmRNA/rRNA uracil-C5-methylase (TrmA/RlmC/RlmD family)